MGAVMGFSLRRSARLAATLGTGVLTVWIIAALGSLGVTDFKNSGAAVPLQDGSEAPSASRASPFTHRMWLSMRIRGHPSQQTR